jgi:hypothetical protein
MREDVFEKIRGDGDFFVQPVVIGFRKNDVAL